MFREQRQKKIPEVFFPLSTDFWDMFWENNFDGHKIYRNTIEQEKTPRSDPQDYMKIKIFQITKEINNLQNGKTCLSATAQAQG